MSLGEILSRTEPLATSANNAEVVLKTAMKKYNSFVECLVGWQMLQAKVKVWPSAG